ncbi:hypothetical protein PG987_012110 [Apiospora arundinis]
MVSVFIKPQPVAPLPRSLPNRLPIIHNRLICIGLILATQFGAAFQIPEQLKNVPGDQYIPRDLVPPEPWPSCRTASAPSNILLGSGPAAPGSSRGMDRAGLLELAFPHGTRQALG